MFEKLVDAVAQDARVRGHRGATEAEIKAAERQLAIRLPSDYVHFVRRWGWVEMDVNAILGLGTDTDSSTSFVDATLRMTQLDDDDGPGAWEPSNIIIYEMGNGDVCYLRTAHPYRGRVPVMNWSHELDEHVVASLSLEEWLNAALDDPDLLPPVSMD